MLPGVIGLSFPKGDRAASAGAGRPVRTSVERGEAEPAGPDPQSEALLADEAALRSLGVKTLAWPTPRSLHLIVGAQAALSFRLSPADQAAVS
jgi:hypothetical protein